MLWHEAGHFVASLYNQRFFGKYGTEAIFIYKHYLSNNTTDYTGSQKPRKPPNYNSADPIKHPASWVGSLAYGCFFQSIFCGQAFSICFSFENDGANGFEDFKDVKTASQRFGLSPEEFEWLLSIIADQFNSIKECGEFKTLFSIDIDSFILSDEDEIQINLDDFELIISGFMTVHEEAYLGFIHKLEFVFGSHICK